MNLTFFELLNIPLMSNATSVRKTDKEYEPSHVFLSDCELTIYSATKEYLAVVDARV